jgi:hypothetical protein
MNTSKKILSMGIILLISGIIAALISFEPSRILQYIFVVTSLTVGILGVLMGKNSKGAFIRSTYYSWIGYGLIALSIALVIWASTLTAFISVLGFFLLLFGFTEFVFALQILNSHTPIPWRVVGLKLTLSATTAIGAASILTIAGINVYFALLFLGVLFALVGLTFIQMSRITTDADPTPTK